MTWNTFFDDLMDGHALEKPATPAAPKPGKVMICFLNRYLKAVDGVKYKFQYDDQEFIGTTTSTNYCFNIQTQTVAPIHVSVWSRKSQAFKALDDVVPIMGTSILRRKILSTAKVHGHTEKHPETPAPAPRPTQPPPPTPPGPSPTTPQGVSPTSTHNEQGEPQTQVQRPVPGKVTVEQLRQIFTSSQEASDAYLQQVADDVNIDLVKFKLDTVLRRAHFFAQIKGEVGQGMKPVTEKWEYSAESLRRFSSYYRGHPDEAVQDGYLKNSHGKITRHANQEAIGRKHFSRLNGNRSDHPEDGSNFRA